MLSGNIGTGKKADQRHSIGMTRIGWIFMDESVSSMASVFDQKPIVV